MLQNQWPVKLATAYSLDEHDICYLMHARYCLVVVDPLSILSLGSSSESSEL